MPEKQQGLGKTRFRQFTRELNNILRNTKSNVGYFSTIDEVEQNIDDLITEFNNDNEVEFTPNWETLWSDRMSEAKERALDELSKFFPEEEDDEFIDEEEFSASINIIDHREDIEVIGYIGDKPIVTDDSYQQLQTVADRRGKGWINEDEMLEDIQPFIDYVIAIQIIGGLYYIWVQKP